METIKQPEYWMRGPVENIPPLLQPVAHALLQARDEVNEMMDDYPPELLWQKPAELASPGFHLQHLSGVIDRLFTYAKAEQLKQEQLYALKAEGKEDETINIQSLLLRFNKLTQQLNSLAKQMKKT